MGKGLVGDFIGFTFNNIHSSTLGITRVSGGDRYTEDLLPTFQDKVVDAPGTDGTYYFGSYFKQKNININIAFDSLSEEQFRRLKQVFGDKQIHELWFDETPYKAYNVKIVNNPNLRYICFEKYEKGASVRVYKGEGTLNFVAYFPFAHSRFKYLDDYNSGFVNKEEWLPSSGIRVKSDLDTSIQLQPGRRQINLWNGGDIETDFKLNIYFEDSEKLTAGFIKINNRILNFKDILRLGKDDGIQINTKTHLIQGFSIKDNKIEITNNIYNKFIDSGNFFKIPVGESKMNLQGLYGYYKGKGLLDIDYQYLYL